MSEVLRGLLYARNGIMECMELVTNSPEETRAIAERIGRQAQGGEVIELVSDLGGGKTTFTRGLADGLSVTDVVSSPTFTISREYEGRLRLCHFDFYRLPEAGIMSDELAEAIADPDAVVVVEWAEVVNHVLPEDRLHITIQPKSEYERILKFAYSHNLSYLLEGLS